MHATVQSEKHHGPHAESSASTYTHACMHAHIPCKLSPEHKNKSNTHINVHACMHIQDTKSNTDIAHTTSMHNIHVLMR
jgi:hypothetical protein